MIFLYDSSDNLLGFTYGGETYFYIKNHMGDVMGIADSSGTWIARYYYNAWGRQIYTKVNSEFENDVQKLAAADYNPLRYRSYMYDGWFDIYYLQSRYYSSEWGKFLNADLPEYAKQQKDDHAGTNLFAYCCNDPVNNVDLDGFTKNPSNKTYTTKDCKTKLRINGSYYNLVYPENPIAFSNDKSWKLLKTYKNSKYDFSSFFKNLSLSSGCLTQKSVWANNAVNVVNAFLSGFKVTYIHAKTRTIISKGRKVKQLVLIVESSTDKNVYKSYGGKTVNIESNLNTVDSVYFKSNVKKLYKKLTNKSSPYRYNTICVTIDKKHKSYVMSYFISCEKNKIYIRPIIFQNDKIRIMGRNGIFGTLHLLYTIPLSTKLYVGKSLKELEKKLK